ncbi:hypothetical protein [Desulfolutivibrio sulfoxidireducens]|uniref:hypothetical protein n=1 Tax=Desulfolutivibrio sulfoxidireducens TaxID=2773299 RepID=UPI00159D6BF4|nr:hypothetical protein [Desulfolutivibrio sulfoxidireducens]QLA16424.1 hypothetical protein GD605_09990 [Desulfolutivibrio sulfoxidireducens]QLA19695.1 hypothetical protein GD604_08070 [Desulfolutivibrio sulfoxidireducens]
MSADTDGNGWVAMASFDGPSEPRPEFEDMLLREMARWGDEASRAGLDPVAHVRLDRDGVTAVISISPELEAAFTPVQTLWRAE